MSLISTPCFFYSKFFNGKLKIIFPEGKQIFLFSSVSWLDVSLSGSPASIDILFAWLICAHPVSLQGVAHTPRYIECIESIVTYCEPDRLGPAYGLQSWYKYHSFPPRLCVCSCTLQMKTTQSQSKTFSKDVWKISQIGDLKGVG